MKKILSTLALATISAFSSYAQDIDLQAFVFIDTTGNPLTDTADRTNTTNISINAGQTFTGNGDYAAPNGATADSIYGTYGMFTNGPDALGSGDQVIFVYSGSRFLREDEALAEGVPFADKYFWLNQLTLSNVIEAPSIVGRFSYLPVDSIGMLMDWDMWVDSGKMSLKGRPHDTYVNGKAYGFFMRIYGLGDANNPTNIDAVPKNNLYVQKVIWNGGVGLKDMLAKTKRENLVVYPNPATSEISFDYNFKVNTTAVLTIRDITGKTVRANNYGRQTAGARNFKYDISGLAAGTYTVEFVTGETNAVSKIVIK
ncbi:hypothetical protein D3C72_1010210 [compost metagenome]